MNEIKTFNAETMQAALDLVRRELGSDAVILQTRHVTIPRRLPFRKPKQEVEITATAQMATATDQRSRTTPVRRSRFSQNGHTHGQNSGTATNAVETVKARSSCTQPRATAAPTLPESFEHLEQLPTSIAARLPADETVNQRLTAIHQMLQQMQRTAHAGNANDLPAELFGLYTELLERDVYDELARDLMFRLQRNATATQWKDPAAARALLTAMVEAELSCAEPIRPVSRKRKVVAMVGPTGVGKTTTVAKLAAGFRLRNEAKIGLITVDTYRIAAVEQLRAYAEIIDVPLKVVTSPSEMRRALDELVGLDLVFVDTGGRNPHDQLKMQEVKSLLTEASADEIHLVLNLSTGLRNLQAAADSFAAVNPTSMVLTKLDEAAALGTMLSICRHVKLPVSYITTGQDVPNDIEPAHALRLTRLILGQDKLHSGPAAA